MEPMVRAEPRNVHPIAPRRAQVEKKVLEDLDKLKGINSRLSKLESSIEGDLQTLDGLNKKGVILAQRQKDSSEQVARGNAMLEEAAALKIQGKKALEESDQKIFALQQNTLDAQAQQKLGQQMKQEGEAMILQARQERVIAQQKQQIAKEGLLGIQEDEIKALSAHQVQREKIYIQLDNGTALLEKKKDIIRNLTVNEKKIELSSIVLNLIAKGAELKILAQVKNTDIIIENEDIKKLKQELNEYSKSCKEFLQSLAVCK